MTLRAVQPERLTLSFFASLGLLLLLFSSSSWSQDAAKNDASMREILESEEQVERLLEEKEQSDPKAIDAQKTPLSSILGLSSAMKAGDYAKASTFLDMRYLPEELDEFTPEQLVQALGYVWNQQNIIDFNSLSDEPEGDLNDDLPSYRERIGVVTISTGEVLILLQRVPDGKGGKVWKLSNATVAKIPEMWKELGYSPVAIYFKGLLPDFQFMGMDNWQVGATVLFFLLAWPVAAILSSILMRIALLIPNRFPLGIQRFFKGPLRFFLFILLARLMVNELGLSLTTRVFMQSSGVDYIAYTVLFMGSISLIRDYQIRKMQHVGKPQLAALLKPMTIIIKTVLITIITLVWADSAGYNMSTILAGLGVGSLAVALAAQKTLENMIGAVTLYTARPVNPGDVCRFGDVVGTVEEIGLRSTTIRTLNRTVVVIPNAVFSAAEIENFSERDRIRFFHEIRLAISSPAQLTTTLEKTRELFSNHSEVMDDTISIRLSRIDDATAILRIDAGVATTNYQEFLRTAEELNLGIVAIVLDLGAGFSGPSQTLKLRQFTDDAKTFAGTGQTV
ncbi:MAG: MscS family membrane protein [Halioglobus sp.]|jgi:MscS family membrane protein